MLIDFVISKLRIPKTSSQKCLKSPVTENRSTRNMVNVPKHNWNLHCSTLIIFIDHYQVNWVGKRLSYWYAKSRDCLLTYWLPMKSILLLIETILRYQFRCNYLRNKQKFLNFLLHLWNLQSVLNILKKRMTFMDLIFPKLRTPKTSSDKCLKCHISENPTRNNMVKFLKHCWNLHHSTFIIFIENCQVNWVGKTLCYWHAKPWDCFLPHWQPMKRILFLRETI